MNMRYLLITILFTTVLMSGCRSVNPEIFRPEEPFPRLLLPLEVHINDQNIESFFVDKKPSIVVCENRILEARYTIRNEFRNKFEERESVYGHVVCQVFRTATANTIWLVPTFLTVGTSALLGVPAVSQHATVRLEVAVLDSNRREVAFYKVIGSATEYSAAYWGYRGDGTALAHLDHNLSQAVNGKALRKALVELNERVRQDVEEINKRLLEAGAIG